MIIASIAMEELALSHILNAEGEKLQYILGTLPGTKPCACPNEVLSINKSVTALLEAVTQNQMLLKNKLERALDACPPPCPHPCPPCRPEPEPHPCPPSCKPEPCPHPCPPPCRPENCFKSILRLESQRAGLLWNQGYCLPWRQLIRRGAELRWNEQNPSKILLNPGRIYVIQYTLNIYTTHPTEEIGTIRFRQNPCSTFTEILPLYFKIEHYENRPQTLQYAAILYPYMGRRNEVELSLMLESPNVLYVEQAVMNIIEL